MENINEGVQIILERLKTNPEDFSYDINMGLSSKWNTLLSEALSLDTITDEEKAELRKEVAKMSRDRFTAKVMKTLLAEDEPSDEGKWRTKVNGMVTGFPTLASSLAVPNGGTGATWGTSSLEHTALHMEALQKLAEAKTQAEKTMLQRLKEKIF